MLKTTVAAVSLLLLLTSGAQTQTKSRTYKIVAAESSFWVFVGKTGLFSGLAHDHEIGVKSFTGQVIVPEAGAGGGSLQLDIDAKSLAVLDKNVSDKDRAEIFNSMHNEVLETAKHPKITFKSAAVSNVKQMGGDSYSFTLSGDLTLHGVTKRIDVPVSATITPQQLRATGKYTLKQTDYGVKPYSAAGGTIKVKNEVVINFNLVAKA